MLTVIVQNLLTGNWRGQLTMIDQLGEWKGNEPPVTSALVTYAAPRGALPASIILHQETDHDIVEVGNSLVDTGTVHS